MTMSRLASILTVGLAFGLASPSPASADQLIGWWGGDWTCTIDGRPARMRWIPAEGSSGLHWRGRFSDNGSRWVDLTNAHLTQNRGFTFRHADGNQWFLPEPTGNRTSGHTTWNGQRFPLVCRH